MTHNLTPGDRETALLALIAKLENAARFHAHTVALKLSDNMARKDANIARKRVREYLRDWVNAMPVPVTAASDQPEDSPDA